MTRKVEKVWPTHRFHVRGAARRLVSGPGEVYFRGHSRYYHCPSCSRKTLVDYRRLHAYSPLPSVLAPEIQSIFDHVELGTHDAAYDFSCRGCGRPVRLLFWSQERGMGGPMDAFVKLVLELED